MPKYWYSVSCQNEVDSYTEAEGITDFPRGTFLAYSKCCLTTGHKSKKEAYDWIKKHPCKQKVSED